MGFSDRSSVQEKVRPSFDRGTDGSGGGKFVLALFSLLVSFLYASFCRSFSRLFFSRWY